MIINLPTMIISRHHCGICRRNSRGEHVVSQAIKQFDIEVVSAV